MSGAPLAGAAAEPAARRSRPRGGAGAYVAALLGLQSAALLAYFTLPLWGAGLAAGYYRAYSLTHLALIAGVLLAREGMVQRRRWLAALGAVAALWWALLWWILLLPLAGQVEVLPESCRRLMSL
jgi:hypothetical protein